MTLVLNPCSFFLTRPPIYSFLQNKHSQIFMFFSSGFVALRYLQCGYAEKYKGFIFIARRMASFFLDKKGPKNQGCGFLATHIRLKS